MCVKIELNQNYNVYVLPKHNKSKKYTYDLDVFIYSKRIGIFRKVKWDIGIICDETELQASVIEEIVNRNKIGYFDKYMEYLEGLHHE